MKHLKVMDARRGVGPAQFGVIVAGDAPDAQQARVLSGHCNPVALRFFDEESRESFEVPVRNLTPVEVILVVNRALQEGAIEFGFRPKGDMASALLGGMQ